MDDIEMLLPGLKVSTGLIRHRPVSPSSDDEHRRQNSDHAQGSQGHGAKSSAGSKRRHCTEWCSADSDGADRQETSPAKRQQGMGFRRLPRRLRLDPSSSPSLDSNPALQCLQAGITSTMINDLHESPRLPSASLSPTSTHDGHSLGTYLRLGLSPVAEPEPSPTSSSLSAPATCRIASSPERTQAVRGGEAVLAPAGSLNPALYQKTKSAPSRIEQEHVCSLRPPQKANSHPVTRESSPGHEVTSSDSSLPQTPRNSLSKAEKWQERINVATLRLRARSLPVTPPRPRAQATAAQ